MRQNPAEPEAAGANALDEGALRHQFHLEFAGQHLPLRLRIKADMAYDGLAQQLGVDEFANSPARHGRVVGNDYEIAFLLPDEFVDHAQRRADGHEAADHQACAVGYQRYGLVEGQRLHDRLTN